ncbi:MAG TPA: hypothetical protein VHC43_14635 [Mycobacteriales bacterium]|nr:hypothetical protein [Mycobacteriales bacterium]
MEVELDTHRLKGHVEEQVRKFARGTYDETHANYIHKQAPDTSVESLREMMLGDQPKVLVLVTAAKPDWAPTLGQYGAQVGVIEMYRDAQDRVLFRVNGEQPSLHSDEVLSRCVPDPMLPKALKLLSPAPFLGMDELEIYVRGELTTWKIYRVADVALLMPVARDPLNALSTARFKIVRRAQGGYGLVEEY